MESVMLGELVTLEYGLADVIVYFGSLQKIVNINLIIKIHGSIAYARTV